MKHIHFDVESDGFYGAYWACKDGSDCAVIAMLGDDPEDYMFTPRRSSHFTAERTI